MTEPERIAAALADVISAIESAETILLTCHPRPDGDSAGSMIALAAMLRAQGKKVTLYSPLRVPRFLHWLPLRETWVHKLPPKATFAVTVIVDCGDEALLGDHFPGPEITGRRVVVDHHAHGKPFGDVQLIDGNASATGVLVWRMAMAAGWPICRDAATGIYVALVSDTGFFRYANTNREAFHVGGELVARDLVCPGDISERLSTLYTGAKLRLISRALAEVKRELGGRVAVVCITPKLLSAAGASWDDTEGLIHYVRNLRGAKCGVFISPARGGGIRVSMRARPDGIDVGAVCAALGGGGHRGAAGCTLEGNLEEARKRVLAAIEAEFVANPS